MCRIARCSHCSKTTWAGCGMHIESIKMQVPPAQWCHCKDDLEKELTARAANSKGGWMSESRSSGGDGEPTVTAATTATASQNRASLSPPAAEKKPKSPPYRAPSSNGRVRSSFVAPAASSKQAAPSPRGSSSGISSAASLLAATASRSSPSSLKTTAGFGSVSDKVYVFCGLALAALVFVL